MLAIVHQTPDSCNDCRLRSLDVCGSQAGSGSIAADQAVLVPAAGECGLFGSWVMQVLCCSCTTDLAIRDNSVTHAGSAGSGKSTLVQHVCSAFGSEGIIYTSSSSKPELFGNRLAEALNLLDPLPNPAAVIYEGLLQLGGAGR